MQVIAEDIYKLDETMNEFGNDCPGGNPYSFDEYNIASAVKDAVLNKEWEALLKLTKKPLFSFIEIEIVKPLKLLAMNPP